MISITEDQVHRNLACKSILSLRILTVSQRLYGSITDHDITSLYGIHLRAVIHRTRSCTYCSTWDGN